MNIVVLERMSVGGDVSVDVFKELGDVTTYNNTVEIADIKERVKDAEVIIFNKSKMNEETLGEAKNVKLICAFATGYDCVDLEYCKKRGITVCNVVDYSTDMVAQHTFAMLFYLLEHLPHYDKYVKSGEYAAQDRFSNFDVPFTEIAGKTWGIIGMGNIGKKVASIATAFGCKVIFYSASGKSTVTEYERVDFDTLLVQSDILSTHCPLSDKTKNIIDKVALEKMKKTAILINVARGPVVNNDDLYEALENGEIAAAGLDVITKEPITEDNPLSKIMDSNKLLITPHMAWASIEARTRLVDEVYENIKAFYNGTPRNVIV